MLLVSGDAFSWRGALKRIDYVSNEVVKQDSGLKQAGFMLPTDYNSISTVIKSAKLVLQSLGISNYIFRL